MEELVNWSMETGSIHSEFFDRFNPWIDLGKASEFSSFKLGRLDRRRGGAWKSRIKAAFPLANPTVIPETLDRGQGSRGNPNSCREREEGPSVSPASLPRSNPRLSSQWNMHRFWSVQFRLLISGKNIRAKNVCLSDRFFLFAYSLTPPSPVSLHRPRVDTKKGKARLIRLDFVPSTFRKQFRSLYGTTLLGLVCRWFFFFFFGPRLVLNHPSLSFSPSFCS